MAESGLAQVLEVVYAENAVKHILSGKAIARAIRGHFIVHAALNTILAANAYKKTIPINGECYDESILHQDLMKAKSLHQEMLMDGNTNSVLSSKDLLHEICHKMNAAKESFKKHRTAQLWLQYMKMIYILRRFIKAERIGNWNLHLQAVQEMLPYFAA